MQCSVCDSPLIKQSFDSICYEYCNRCSGYWFDGNEITKVLDYLIVQKEILDDDAAPKTNGKLKTGYCPKCNQIAKPVTVYKKEYSFLKCVGCNGIWIDKYNLSLLLKDWKKNTHIFGKNYFSPNRNPKFLQSGETFLSYAGWTEDINPLNRIPFTTILLIILNVIGFFIWNPFITFNKEILFTPSNFFSDPAAFWPSVFTSMFTHADIDHLTGNMIFLFIFGNNVEDRIGHYKFFFLYLLLGILASLGYAFVTTQPNVPTLGASGAVSGIMGCYLLLYPKINMKLHRSLFLIPYNINIPVWVYLGVWFLGQQLIGVTAEIQGIAWYAHLIGFICGYIIMFLMKKLNFL